MKHLIKVNFVISLMFFGSCQNEDALQEKTIHTKPAEFVKVENGRLHFSNKDFLNRKIEEFKDKGNRYAANTLAELYDKDFYSLRPILNQEKENKALMQKFANRRSHIQLSARTNQTDSNDLDDLEGLIGDDEFASFINDKGEIQVADSIYKYTKDGLFFVHKSDIEYLNDYLVKMQNPHSSPKNSKVNINYRVYAMPETGLRRVDDKIMGYIAPDYGGYSSGGGGSGSNSVGDDVVGELDTFIENLPVCEVKGGLLR